MNSKQVVLITGSSTGFGRLFADTLARKGTPFSRRCVNPVAAMPRMPPKSVRLRKKIHCQYTSLSWM